MYIPLTSLSSLKLENWTPSTIWDACMICVQKLIDTELMQVLIHFLPLLYHLYGFLGIVLQPLHLHFSSSWGPLLLQKRFGIKVYEDRTAVLICNHWLYDFFQSIWPKFKAHQPEIQLNLNELTLMIEDSKHYRQSKVCHWHHDLDRRQLHIQNNFSQMAS